MNYCNINYKETLSKTPHFIYYDIGLQIVMNNNYIKELILIFILPCELQYYTGYLKESIIEDYLEY
jgi:hypothetical protein